MGVAAAEGTDAGQQLTGWGKDTDETICVAAPDAIAPCHALAPADLEEGASVLGYGHDSVRTVEPIGKGGHVHARSTLTRRGRA